MRYLADLREALPRGIVTAVAAVAAACSIAAAPKVEIAAAVWGWSNPPAWHHLEERLFPVADTLERKSEVEGAVPEGR